LPNGKNKIKIENWEESEILGRIRLSICFSRILVKNGSKLIGQKEDNESGSLLGSGTRTMVENVHRIEKYESLEMELKILERYIMAF